MSRVRTDHVFGITTDAPLTAGATTINSAGLANLAAVSSAEAILILDPNRVSGAPEIVIVTAHTSSATSATITRAAFGTSAREHAAGTEWVHGPIASNATSYATAADDQGDFVPMNGWEAYTPTNVNVTVGNGTQTARFTRIGRTIHWIYKLVWGSSTSFGGNVNIGLPVAAQQTSNGVVGLVYCEDASGSDFLGLATSFSSGTTTFLRLDATSNVVSNTAPFTWVSTDTLSISGTYEAAS